MGYRYQKAANEHGQSRWVVMPENAAIVKQMFTWYAEETYTLSDIARQLNQQHTPSPQGKNWNCATIGRMLRQSAYKGTAYYARYRSDYSAVGQRHKQGYGRMKNPRYIQRPADEWITVTVPALVSESLWQAVQERLLMNARFSQRNSRRPYLFRGLLICDVCGATLQGRTNKHGVVYFCAFGGKKRSPDVPEHRCTIKEDELDAQLWQELRNLLEQPALLEQAWQAFTGQTASGADETSRWQKRHDLLQKRRRRLLKAYEVEA